MPPAVTSSRRRRHRPRRISPVPGSPQGAAPEDPHRPEPRLRRSGGAGRPRGSPFDQWELTMVPFLRRLVLLILLAPATPVLAQSVTLGDGFYNIAGDPEVGTEASYGSARGWSVVAGFAGNTFAFCAAQTVGPDGTWRFGYDAGGQWQMALLQPFAGDTPYGSLDFDGHVSGIAGWGDGSWLILWLGLGEYEAIGSGNQVTVDLG